MTRLNLRENLWYKIGTIWEALTARKKVGELVSEIFSDVETYPYILLGSWYDSLSVPKLFNFDQIANREHNQRVEWILQILEKFPWIDLLELEDGWIKSPKSMYRKTRGSMNIWSISDITRCRLIAPDLRTMLKLTEFVKDKLIEKWAPYSLFRLRNRYKSWNTSDTFYSWVFITTGDALSNPRNHQITISNEDNNILQWIIDEVKRINWWNRGIYFWTPDDGLEPNIKKRIRELKKIYETILSKYWNERKRIAQIHADLDVSTEIQIMTKRVRMVSERNREQYDELVWREKKWVDFSEYNKAVLRAILLDWKEYFTQKNPR